MLFAILHGVKRHYCCIVIIIAVTSVTIIMIAVTSVSIA